MHTEPILLLDFSGNPQAEMFTFISQKMKSWKKWKKLMVFDIGVRESEEGEGEDVRLKGRKEKVCIQTGAGERNP